MPAISIIIPTFNHARSLPTTLASIFKQTFQDFEVIVVDDGSTDQTFNAVAPYLDKITYFKTINSGANSARNRGAARARGDQLLFCDADIILATNFLEILNTALKNNPSASFAYSAFKFGWKNFPLQHWSVTNLKKFNYIHTTSLIRAKDFPGFDANIKRLQDWDLWLTMADQGKIGIGVANTSFQVELDGLSRIGSHWMPKLFYTLPWEKLGWVPEILQKYFQARAVIANKHSLDKSFIATRLVTPPPTTDATNLPTSKPFFSSTILIGLIAFHGLAALASTRPDLATFMLVAIFLTGFYLSIRSLPAALGIALIELMVGGHGHLLEGELGGVSIFLRLAIFAGIMSGFSGGLLLKKYKPIVYYPQLIIYGSLALTVIYGVLIGLKTNPIATVFDDSNSYSFLLYFIPLISINWTKALQDQVVRLLFNGAIFIAGWTILQVYLFNHLGGIPIQDLYTFVRDSRTFEVTLLKNEFITAWLGNHPWYFRIFGQGQIFLAVSLGAWWWVLATTKWQPKIIIPFILIITALVASWSRSIIIGIILALPILYYLPRLNKTIKSIIILGFKTSTLVLISFLGFFVITIIPPTVDLTSASFYKNTAQNTRDLAVTSRWNLLPPLNSLIMADPLLGSGLGRSVTYISDDPRIRAEIPSGELSTYRFEWGYHDLAVKFGLAGLLIWLLALAAIIKIMLSGSQAIQLSNQAHPTSTPPLTDYYLRVSYAFGLIVLIGTNIFSPYFNHPIGLGYLLLGLVFWPTFPSIQLKNLTQTVSVVSNQLLSTQAPATRELNSH